MGTTFQVTFDSADPVTHAAFWAEALQYVSPRQEAAEPEVWTGAVGVDDSSPSEPQTSAVLVDPDGIGPRLYFQQVPEPKTAKNRVHLDLRAAENVPAERRTEALEAESARLVALGASQLRRLEADEVNDLCIVMQDPEGNEFCLD